MVKHTKKSSRKPKNSRKKINVFLDLDNTLIYSIDVDKIPKNDPPKWMKKFKSHEMKNNYIIFERPGLRPFLNWLFKNFNVSIWSAASPDYVEFIAKNIVENKKNGRILEYVMNSDNCEDSQLKYGEDMIKNLELVWDVHDLEGFGPYNTLIIDDLKQVTNPQKNNAIRIKKFIARQNSVGDNELTNVKKKLIEIKRNFKNINKPSFKLVEN
jgi:TFIIF-interacting CTD phosphatase-like protein